MSSNNTDRERNCRGVLSYILAIPIIGDAFRITNAYTYDGDGRSDSAVAPLDFWIRKHLAALIATLVFTSIVDPCQELLDITAQFLPASWNATPRISGNPGSLIIGIFPNLLGFGIGVYALIFSLSTTFVKRVQSHLQQKEGNSETTSGSVLMLNADMAYPLLVMAVALAIGVAQQVYPNISLLRTLAWAALWYSLLMAMEILSALYSLGEHGLLEKVSTPDAPQPGDTVPPDSQMSWPPSTPIVSSPAK